MSEAILLAQKLPVVANRLSTATNDAQLTAGIAFLGFGAGGSGMTSVTNNGVIYSFNSIGQFTMTNTSTHSMFQVGTNGHLKIVDQYGSEFHQTTNSFQSQIKVGGVTKTLLFSNDIMSVDGMALISAESITNSTWGVAPTNTPAARNASSYYYFPTPPFNSTNYPHSVLSTN